VVADQDGDGRADGSRVPHSSHDFGVVAFDLHATAPAKALLPPPEFAIHARERDGDSGGQPSERSYEAFAMGLAGGLESQHNTELFIVANSNNRLFGCVSFMTGGEQW
jgi:hypothetical protein